MPIIFKSAHSSHNLSDNDCVHFIVVGEKRSQKVNVVMLIIVEITIVTDTQQIIRNEWCEKPCLLLDRSRQQLWSQYRRTHQLPLALKRKQVQWYVCVCHDVDDCVVGVCMNWIISQFKESVVTLSHTHHCSSHRTRWWRRWWLWWWLWRLRWWFWLWGWWGWLRGPRLPAQQWGLVQRP